MGASESTGLPGHTCCRYGGRDPQNGAAIGAYFDHNQSENHQGVLLVTEQAVENYNADSGDRRLRFANGRRFCCCDFHGLTKLGSVLALGADTGEVFILDASTFAYIKAISGNDREASLHGPEVEVELTTMRRPEAAHGDDEEQARGRRVTCVHIADEDTVVSGHANGDVKAYRISRGEVQMTYVRPGGGGGGGGEGGQQTPGAQSSTPKRQQQQQQEEEEVEQGGAGRGGSRRGEDPAAAAAVTALAACTIQVQSSKKPEACLMVGYRDGRVCVFDRASGKCVRSLLGGPGLRSLHFLPSLHTAVLSFAKTNEVWLWDLELDQVQAVDFVEELRTLRHEGSVSTCLHADASRQLLLSATDDSKIYVRKLVRAAGAEGNGSCYYSVQLLRVGCPASSQPPPPPPAASSSGGLLLRRASSSSMSSSSAGAGSSGCVTCLWYDSVADTAFVGDGSGALRVIKDASGGVKG